MCCNVVYEFILIYHPTHKSRVRVMVVDDRIHAKIVINRHDCERESDVMNMFNMCANMVNACAESVQCSNVYVTTSVTNPSLKRQFINMIHNFIAPDETPDEIPTSRSPVDQPTEPISGMTYSELGSELAPMPIKSAMPIPTHYLALMSDNDIAQYIYGQIAAGCTSPELVALTTSKRRKLFNWVHNLTKNKLSNERVNNIVSMITPRD